MRTWCSPGGIGGVALDLEALQAEQVVAVDRPAVLRVEAPAAEGAALGDDHAAARRRSGTTTCGGDRVRLVLDVEDASSRSAGPCPPNRSCELPRISCGRPARSGLKRSTRRSSSGSTSYLTASIRNSRWSSCSFSGCSAREVVGLRPVVGRVELPDVVVEGRQLPAIDPGRAVPVTAVQPLW